MTKKTVLFLLLMCYFICGVAQIDNNVVKLNTSRITNSFYKGLTKDLMMVKDSMYYYSYVRSPRPETHYSTNKYYVVFNDYSCEEADEVDEALFDSSKGDFMIAFVALTSQNHVVTQDWLFTLRFDGTKIDSICIRKSYRVEGGFISDYVAKIDSNLSVTTSELVTVNLPNSTKFNGAINAEGVMNISSAYRRVRSFVIDKDGRIVRQTSTTFSRGLYTLDDVKYNKTYSIGLKKRIPQRRK